MNWEQVCEVCQTELEQLEAKLPPLKDFFPPNENLGENFLRYEKETNKMVESAVRQFAAKNEWPSLTPIEKIMLSFRLDFAASTACLLAQQPAPWADAEQHNEREHRLAWLMLFAWDNEGFSRLQKTLQRLTTK